MIKKSSVKTKNFIKTNYGSHLRKIETIKKDK